MTTSERAPRAAHDRRHDANGPSLMSVEDALAEIFAAISGPLPAEHLSPVDALGRVLAEPVIASTSLPPWDNSAMDGYALRSADTTAATVIRPVTLRVIGEARAGVATDITVEPGTAVRIATGAPLPPGADAVIPVEQTAAVDERREALGSPGRDATGPLPAGCQIGEPVSAGGAVRSAGSDVRAGATVLAARTELSPPGVALASGVGASEVAVYRQPRIAVLATGDEIRDAGEPLGPAGIPDANRPGLIASVTAAGGIAVDVGLARDELADMVGRLRRALDEGVDAIIVSGGVSVGPYDVVKTAFDQIGRIELWRVAVQPGKPFAFGVAPRTDGVPVLLFGLPGNPVSSLVTFELFVRPALRRLAGHPVDRLYRPRDRAVLGERVSKSHGRRAFLRVRAERDERGVAARDGSGRVRVRLAGGQGSHVLSAIAAADGLAIVPEADDELPAGAEVELWWLDPG